MAQPRGRRHLAALRSVPPERSGPETATEAGPFRAEKRGSPAFFAPLSFACPAPRGRARPRHGGAGRAALRGAAAGLGAAHGRERRPGAQRRGGGAAGRGRVLPAAGGHAEQLPVPQAHPAAPSHRGGFQPSPALEQRRGRVWLWLAGLAAVPAAPRGGFVLPRGPGGEPGGAGAGHQHPQGLCRDHRQSARVLPGWQREPGAAGSSAQRRVLAQRRSAQVLPARHPGRAGGRPPADEGGSAGSPEQPQNRGAAALLRLRGQWGEIREPRPGAAEPAAAAGAELAAESLPVPGLLRGQPGGLGALLRAGAAGRLHQPPERPLDPARLRRAAAGPHLLEPRGAGAGAVPADPALAPESSGRSGAAALLALRRRGGAARAGLEGRGAGAVPPPRHVLAQSPGRAGRLLRVQRSGQGRWPQSLRRHLGRRGAAAESQSSTSSWIWGSRGVPPARPPRPRPLPRAGFWPLGVTGGRHPLLFLLLLLLLLLVAVAAGHVPRALRFFRGQPGRSLRHRRPRRPPEPPGHGRGCPQGAAGRRSRPQNAPTDQRHREPQGRGASPGPPGATPAAPDPGTPAPAPRDPPHPFGSSPARRSGRVPEMSLRPSGAAPLQFCHRGAPDRAALPRAPLPDEFPAAARGCAGLPVRAAPAHDRPHRAGPAPLAPRRVLAAAAALSGDGVERLIKGAWWSLSGLEWSLSGCGGQ